MKQGLMERTKFDVIEQLIRWDVNIYSTPIFVAALSAHCLVIS